MRDPKGPVKPYKSPQEIATQHKVPLAAVMKQVKMGTKVEGEHTTSKSGARITALQHVDELPDYYTKLKKVEKIKEGNLHQWFHGSKSKEGKPGWVNVVTGGSCASDEPGEGTPKCVSSSKRASMTKAERLSASRRKKAADPGQQEKSGAAKPTYVPTDKPKKKMNEESDVKSKGSGTKDACYHKVKARFKVWPSAYASGALVKCRQAGAKNWGNKSEAANPAQQAAIAISMKKAGKKPKGMKEEMTADAQYLKDTKYCLLCRKNEKRHECGYGPQMWDRYSIAKIHPANMPEEKEYSNIEEKFVKAQNPSSGRKSLSDRQSYKGTETTPFRGSASRPLRQEIARSSGRSKKPMKEDHVAIAMGKMLDSEGGMIMSQLDQIEMAVAKLRKLVKDPQMQVPAWVQSKITMATDYIDTAADYMSSKNEEVSEACWTGYKQVGMKKKGKKMVPNCVPANEDSCQSFSQFMQIAEDIRNPERRAKLSSIMDREVRKGDKSKGENPRKKYHTKTGKQALGLLHGGSETGSPKAPVRSRGGGTVPSNERVVKSHRASNRQYWAGVSGPSRDRGAGSAAARRAASLKKEEVEIAEVAAWQRKEGKNPSGGLNEKGRKSYERENPGSNLQAPQPEGGPRKRSFCARMGGMPGPMKDEKGRPTRKALALRKWKC